MRSLANSSRDGIGAAARVRLAGAIDVLAIAARTPFAGVGGNTPSADDSGMGQPPPDHRPADRHANVQRLVLFHRARYRAAD